ncbi:MAG TPA: hypothetical protein VIY26_17035 [Acidimicrobiales bacterium]
MSARAVLVAALAGGCAVAGGLFCFGGLGGFAGAAAPPLSPGGVELTTSLQGFTPAPAGAFNGPVSMTTLLTYTTDPDVLEEIEDGSVSAYLRTWSRPYFGTDGIIADLVVEFPNAADTAAFLDGLEGELSTQSAVTTFAVTTPSGAEGYAAHGVIVPNSTDVAVSLGRGDFATFVMAATPGGNVSRSQIELVAAAQWGAFPGGSGAGASSVRVRLPTKLPALLPASDLSSSSAGGVEALLVVVVAVVGAVVLVLLAADFVGRRRRRGPAGAGAGAGADPEPGADDSDADDPGAVDGEAGPLTEPVPVPAAGEGVGA